MPISQEVADKIRSTRRSLSQMKKDGTFSFIERGIEEEALELINTLVSAYDLLEELQDQLNSIWASAATIALGDASDDVSQDAQDSKCARLRELIADIERRLERTERGLRARSAMRRPRLLK